MTVLELFAIQEVKEMSRFFVAASNVFGGVAYLDAKTVEHLRVLRIRQGEIFTVCDGEGTDYICRLTDRDDGGVEILEKKPTSGEPSVDVTVFAAFSKGDRMEMVIQKCVELGAKELVLFPSARCVARPAESSIVKKQNRWQAIALEAAKQSDRGIVPRVRIHMAFDAAVYGALKSSLPLLLYESEQEVKLRDALESRPGAKSISIFSGPEGGFEPTEAAFAKESGLISVSLGPRVLRCETAPLCALSAIMFFTDNM